MLNTPASFASGICMTTGRIDGKTPALLGNSLAHDAIALTGGSKPHRLVFDELGDREAVMRFDEVEIIERDTGVGARRLPGLAGPGEGGRVTPRQRQEIVDVSAGTERDGPLEPLGRSALARGFVAAVPGTASQPKPTGRPRRSTPGPADHGRRSTRCDAANRPPAPTTAGRQCRSRRCDRPPFPRRGLAGRAPTLGATCRLPRHRTQPTHAPAPL